MIILNTPDKKTILIIGGSLGALTLNISVIKNLEALESSNVQVLWQCGKLYHERISEQLKEKNLKNVKLVQFISRMDLAYAISDIVISRAGAISVSELCLVQKPTILVPSPNVAEDHQTKNAMALVEKDAAILVKDIDAQANLISTALELLEDTARMKVLGENIAKLGKPNATKEIVDELEKLIV